MTDKQKLQKIEKYCFDYIQDKNIKNMTYAGSRALEEI